VIVIQWIVCTRKPCKNDPEMGTNELTILCYIYLYVCARHRRLDFSIIIVRNNAPRRRYTKRHFAYLSLERERNVLLFVSQSSDFDSGVGVSARDFSLVVNNSRDTFSGLNYNIYVCIRTYLLYVLHRVRRRRAIAF